jgi:hypothetical protein
MSRAAGILEAFNFVRFTHSCSLFLFLSNVQHTNTHITPAEEEAVSDCSTSDMSFENSLTMGERGERVSGVRGAHMGEKEDGSPFFAAPVPTVLQQ